MISLADSIATEELKAAVQGRNNVNMKDLKHLDRFLHTGRCYD